MTAEESTQFKCTKCSKKFKYDSERKRHEKSHSPQFECNICGKKFSFISALRRHEKQHDRKGTAECEECGKRFLDEALLYRHMNYAHKAASTCTKCKATFNSNLALQAHMKTHKPESERKYRCSYEGCEKSFNFSHHLKHHELVHTNTKQHHCSECGKGFIQEYHLKVHLRTHDPSKWLYCKVPSCNKKFATYSARKRHMATHSKIEKYSDRDNISLDNVELLYDIQDAETQNTDGIFCEESSTKIDNKNEHASERETAKLMQSLEDANLLNCLTQSLKIDADMTPNVSPELDRRNDCKTVLGSCIMDSNKECLCDQINDAHKGETVNAVTTSRSYKLNERMVKDGDKITCANDDENEMCEDCECSSICKENNIKPSSCPGLFRVLPDIEYRENGTIKIKSTFDTSIPVIVHKIEDSASALKRELNVPFNSCKDILGNCIVSGNGTIGEGCLCAKMMADDQGAMAQEIEDIMPHPKSDLLKNL